MRGATHTQHTALPPKPGCSSSSLLPPTSRQLAPLVPPNSSPHSYRKPQLPFFLTPTENPQLPIFFAHTTTRLVICYSAQIRERDATPSRKMESADPSAKKMRLPPAATPVLDPAPGSVGRSGDPAPTGSPGTRRISGGPHQRSPGRRPWGDHLASPHQGLLPHTSPLNSVAPSMAHRAPQSRLSSDICPS